MDKELHHPIVQYMEFNNMNGDEVDWILYLVILFSFSVTYLAGKGAYAFLDDQWLPLIGIS